jgi:biofilm protein TabA
VGCDGDYWYETPAEADEVAKLKYDISQTDWILIADPLPDCQQDFIRPVRVVGRNIGKPEFGKLEELKDGSWVPLKGQKHKAYIAHTGFFEAAWAANAFHPAIEPYA